MSKELILNDELLKKFKAKFTEKAEPSDFYCFKARAFSTEPLTYTGIYDGATAVPATLYEMADLINNSNENIGVLELHDSRDLSLGRCFSAEVFNEGTVHSLQVCMAILRTAETEDIIKKIDLGVLDEVSVSIVPRHARCSACEFDYMGPDATFDNYFECTCPNGHKIGVDGVHCILEGIDNFSEISVVNRGAAENPKILDNERREAYVYKLAAAKGFKNVDKRKVLICSLKMEDTMDEEKIEASETKEAPATEAPATEEAKTQEAPGTELSAELSEAKAEIERLKAQCDLQTKLTAAEAAIKEKDEKIAAIEASLKEKDDEIAKLKEELEASKASLSASEESGKKTMEFLKSEVKKVLVASGSKEEIPEDLNGISEMLGKNQQLLATLIPAGGASKQFYSSHKQSKTASGELEAYQVKTK